MRSVCLFWVASSTLGAVPCFDATPVVDRLRAGNGAAAAALLRLEAERCQSDPDWHYLMARSNWLLQELSQAQASLARALELHDSDPEYHRFGANLHAKAGNMEIARLHVKKMLSVTGSASPSRVDLLWAAVLARNGRPRAALSIANKVLEADAANPDALYYRGLFQQAVGEGEAAALTFEQLLRIQPAHADARRQWAAIHIEAGRAAQALPLLADHPAQGKSAEVSFLLSRAYLQLGRVDDGRRLAEEATRLGAAEPRYWRHLGAVLLRSSDVAGGRQAMQRAEQLEWRATN